MTDGRFIPALRLRALTRWYDPLVERWTPAAQMRAAVIEALELRPGTRVLELGCGPGRLAIAIARQYPQVAVEAVDADAAMIALTQRYAKKAEVAINVVQADVAMLPLSGPYDRVYSTLVFHHLRPDRKQQALQEVRRVLRPGGWFVIADFGVPRGSVQWLLSAVIHPLDGIPNTAPHRDGRFERLLRASFRRVNSTAVWRTVFGTIELFVCETTGHPAAAR